MAIELKQVNKAMSMSESHLDASQRVANLGSYNLNLRTGVWTISEVLNEIFGIDENYITDVKGWAKLIHPEDRNDIMAYLLKEVVDNKKRFNKDYRIIDFASKKEKWVHGLGELQIDDDGNVIGIIGTIQDISKRKYAEESLYNSNSELGIINQIANIFLTSPENEIFHDVLKIILEITKSQCGGFGYIDEDGNLAIPSLTYDIGDDFIFEEKGIIFSCEQMKNTPFGRAILKKKSFYSNTPLDTSECHFIISKALYVPIIFHESVVGHLFVGNKEIDYNDDNLNQLNAIANSIAPILFARSQEEKQERERKILEEQFFKAQKMESIGRLAGSIAHDFNNILTIIMSYAEFLSTHFNDQSTRESNAANMIFKGATRASKLTRQLLEIARSGKYEQKAVNVNEVIEETIKVSERIFEKQVQLSCEYEEKICTVIADKNQLDQVFTNILINAKDAMPKGGAVFIKTENAVVTEKMTKKLPGFVSGNYVKISITDNGIGMVNDVSEKIFEPFFTTKGEGKGTGLGLASAYGIIKNHEGFIYCKSQISKGTTFTIYLPASNEKVIEEKADHKVVHGDSTILVVEDDDDILTITKMALERLEYTVLTAKNGFDAIEKYKSESGNIDLILLGMIMPGKTGKETFQELKRIDPEVRVLLFSGYSQDGQVSVLLKEGVLGFLQKPFSLQELSKSIAGALKK